MQAKGHGSGPSNFPGQMPTTDDEIQEKYLERAIRELNRLTHELQECELCPRGGLMPAASRVKLLLVTTSECGTTPSASTCRSP